MRTLKIVNDGLVDTGNAGKRIVCPYTFKAGTDDCAQCTTNCAWFGIVEEYESPLNKNVHCGKKVIGRLGK